MKIAHLAFSGSPSYRGFLLLTCRRGNQVFRWVAGTISAACLLLAFRAAADPGIADFARFRPSSLDFLVMPTIPFQPEYERTMDRVLLAFQRSGDTDLLPWNLAHTLRALPTYSDVAVNWPGAGNSRFKRYDWFQSIAPARLASNAGETLIAKGLSKWPQDMGEGAGNRFLLGRKGQSGQRRGGCFAELGFEAIPHPLPLDGGNVLLARNKSGERIVFVGNDEFFEASENLFRKENVSPARPEILQAVEQAYLKTFSADRLVVLHNGGTSHIDQWVTFVGNGLAVTEAMPQISPEARRTAVRCRVDLANADTSFPREPVPVFDEHYQGDTRILRRDPWNKDRWFEDIPLKYMSRAQEQVWASYVTRQPDLFDVDFIATHDSTRRRIEATLEQHGFEIVRLRTTVRHVLNEDRFVNAMAFRNRETGKPSILFPVYGHPEEFPPELTVAKLTGINRDNAKLLTRLGLEVVPVPAEGRNQGNLHCSMFQF